MPSPETWHRIEELFDAAVDLSPGERAAMLERACAGDEPLRLEVESLLASDESAATFIEAAASSIPQDLLAAVEDEDNEPLAGRHFGAYRIVREIGRGGLGAVYLAARADEQYEKQVAIKLVKRGLDTDDILRRFRAERQILAQLDHPNIARLMDAGSTADGRPYFVMEYVEAQPISSYCNVQQLSTASRLELFRVVCGAVTYAHQHLVVHRDLKPSNILVTQHGEVKLLDFGIAKVIGGEAEVGMRTVTEMRMMTPEYASPEQVRGESVTTSSDVYSLGVVLYELLTGGKPYRLTNPTPQKLERAITEVEPQRPSTIVAGDEGGPSRDRKSLRGDLDNIVLMALRKEPARRYASVQQLSDDIRRHLESLPVVARKDTWSYRSAKFVRRHRVGVAALSLIFLSLIGGIVATVRQTRKAERERGKAEATSAFLQNMLAASSPIVNLRARDLTVKDALDEASKRLSADDLSSQPEIKAELQRIIGVSYFSIGQYELAELNLSAALQAKNRLSGEDSPDALKTLVSLAHIWAGATGNYARANRFYEEKLPLLRMAQRKGRISADWLADALNGDALLQRAQGDSKKAEMLLREELGLRHQLSPVIRDDLSGTDSVLALTLADQGNFNEAIRIVRDKLEALREQNQERTPAHCGALTGLGSFLIEQGAFGEAEEYLRNAEAIYRKLYDASNMQLGDNLRLQAQALSSQQQDTEAEGKINEALQIYRASSSPHYVNYATALIVQGIICSHTGRTDEAERLLREAVRIRTENVPPTHFLRAMSEGALGDFLISQSHLVEAEPLLLGSYKSLKASQGENSPRTNLALRRLVLLYDAWPRPEQAATYRGFIPATTR